jgi:hypothetical protein
MKNVKIDDFEMLNRYLEMPIESILNISILIQEVYIILDICLDNLEANYMAKDLFGFWKINFIFPVSMLIGTRQLFFNEILLEVFNAGL